MNQQNVNCKEPLAVVGIGCRLPGDVFSADELWKMLLEKKDGIIDVPKDRWDINVFYDPNPDKSGRIKNRQGGFIKDIDKFDADFFGFFSEEASQLDPQQRMLLEVACDALEDGGIKLSEVSGTRTSVFVSGFLYDHLCMILSSGQRDIVNPYAAMGVGVCSLANRISYCLNLKGPSIAVDTACSGSLVAIHLASNSIWNGEADMALAGGVNALLKPESSIVMSKAGFLSPDARCKAFDESGNGYVRSEGAGIVFIKKLSKALEDNDQIYGVIRGTAVNQDGYTPAGFTVPDMNAQIAMLKAAYEDAKINPQEVSYVEAHGPGTPVGDPIETGALGAILGNGRKEGAKLFVGSVKTNIGHLEGASGIAGFIKASLVMKNKLIPPNLHFNVPNPNIDFEKFRIKVPTEVMPLISMTNGEPVIGINSFGAGGTNAHVVMQGYSMESAQPKYAYPNNWHLFVISARTNAALKEYAKNYIDFLLKDTATPLVDISLAQFTRKSRHQHQLFVIAKTREEYLRALQEFIVGSVSHNAFYFSRQAEQVQPKIAFMYSGQGGQWAQMGLALYESEPIFKRTMDEFDAYFESISGWSVIKEMNKPEGFSNIDKTIVAQPAIVAIQVSLTNLLKAYGISPKGITGHSIGEVSAAYASGAFSLEDAAKIIYHRSQVQDKASGKGKMLAIAISAEEATSLIQNVKDVVSIATINSPQMITIAGDEKCIADIAKVMEAKGIFNRYVNVAVPYHSHYMDPLKEELEERLGSFKAADIVTNLYSTVTTALQTVEDFTGEYWFKNVRSPVRFVETIENMLEDDFNCFIELGPHPVLTTGVKDILKLKKLDCAVASTMNKKLASSSFTFFEAITAALSFGDSMFLIKGKGKPINLPKYPWQRQKFWFEAPEEKAKRVTNQKYPFFKKSQQFVTDSSHKLWEVGVGLGTTPYLADHLVDGSVVYPGAAHIMMALSVAADTFEHDEVFLHDIRFENAIIVPDSKNSYLDVRFEMTSVEGGFSICSRDSSSESDTPWTKHSFGKINYMRDEFNSSAPVFSEFRSLFSEKDQMNVSDFYSTIRESGLNYGKTFQCIKEMWISGNKVLAKLELDDSLIEEAHRYLIHPTVFDAYLQATFADQQKNGNPKKVYLPESIDKVRVLGKGTKVTWACVEVFGNNETWLRSNHWLYDDKFNLISELQGMAAKSLPSSVGEDIGHENCAEYKWVTSGIVQEGTWLPVVDGDLLNVFLINENNLQFSKALINSLNSSLSQVKTTSFVDISKALIKLGQETLDRRTQIIYIPNENPIESGEALKLFKFLSDKKATSNLIVLTRHASVVLETDRGVNLSHAALFGMLRVFQNEFPNVYSRIIDIDDYNELTLNLLTNEILSKRIDLMESEIAYRGSSRYIRQLLFIDSDEINKQLIRSIPSSGYSYKPYFESSGMIGEVRFREVENSPVRDEEVEIQVKAASLNYKDVMNAMGLLSKKSVAGGLAGDKLGLEVSGVVSSVGKKITQFRPGDEVLARVVNGFSGRCLASEDLVTHKPKNFSFEEAAAVPVVYVTAHYGLNYLGRMAKGETVLIHSATGGVGIAAIHLARAVGANVIATAGTRKKRSQLRKDFGVEHVFDSRSNSFYDEVMKVTEGRGVDLVLNSLTGPLITQSLKCLAPYGRFIELGKTDVYSNGVINMERLGENISYHVVDVDRLAAQKPTLHKQLLTEALSLIAKNNIPPHPIVSFPVFKLDEALRQMTRAAHVGKFVVTMGDVIPVMPPKNYSISSTGSILITGGASGLGLRIAEWLTTKGARHLVLASRSGVKHASDQKIIDEMISSGIKVELMSLDVSKEDEVHNIVSYLHSVAGGLSGVVHAAGVLDDALIPNMTSERFNFVFNPKANGALYLHEACIKSGANPSLFLMISSMSSVLGLKGQINYASANYFLDALAEHRKSSGLSAISVNLGVLGEYAGMSMKEKDETDVLGLLETHGFDSMTKNEVLSKIEMSLIEKPAQRLCAAIRWKNFGLAYPNLARDSRFAEIFNDINKRKSGKKKGMNVRDELVLIPIDQKKDFLALRIATAISELTGMNIESISIHESIAKWSLDSIMLGQISAWILRNTEINYPLIKLVKGPSLIEVANELITQLKTSSDENKTVESVTDRSEDEGKLLFELGFTKLSNFIFRGKSTGRESKQLVCFHSMGVGASLFTHFLLNPPEDTDILVIQLPGREDRYHEVPLQSVDEVVDQVVTELKSHLKANYAIWGHSFGGVISFEIIKRLRENGVVLPKHLMLTATIAPHLVKLWQNRDVLLRVLVEENRAEYLTSLSRYIEDPEFIERILPIMRKDMPLLKSYKYREQDSLDLPITVWAANQDDVVYPDEVSQWSQHTNKEFRFYEVDGDHWFLNSNKDRISEVLRQIL